MIQKETAMYLQNVSNLRTISNVLKDMGYENMSMELSLIANSYETLIESYSKLQYDDKK